MLSRLFVSFSIYPAKKRGAKILVRKLNPRGLYGNFILFYFITVDRKTPNDRYSPDRKYEKRKKGNIKVCTLSRPDKSKVKQLFVHRIVTHQPVTLEIFFSDKTLCIFLYFKNHEKASNAIEKIEFLSNISIECSFIGSRGHE